ncbi:hypothetical protein ACPA9J_10095 [Pseudomonas aeruginosa]
MTGPSGRHQTKLYNLPVALEGAAGDVLALRLKPSAKESRNRLA